MSDVAIKVENLSKRYRIGLKEEMHDTFFGMLSSWAKSPVENFRRVRSLSKFDDNGTADDIIWALRDVSFEVKYGEVLGIIGRNGAGKSTLLKILCRITEPTSGRAFVNGRVASLLEVGTGFHPELTGRENVYLNGTILGMSKTEIDSKFYEIVDFSGVEKFIDTPVKRYSSGMKVRLAFAVAAHLEPEILLIDEVLAVGDTEFQKKCLGKMGDVAKGGRTIFFVSHNMNAIQNICKRCILLENGQLTCDDIPSKVVTQYFKKNVDIGEANLNTIVDRQGSGRARFTFIRLINNKGQMVSSIPMGHSLTIELHFRIIQGSLSNPNFGVFVISSFNQQIMHFNTKITTGQMPQATKGGKIYLNIDRLDLLPSIYYLYIAINNNDEKLDHISEAIKFEITPYPIYPTGRLPLHRGLLMFAPCSWSHKYD